MDNFVQFAVCFMTLTSASAIKIAMIEGHYTDPGEREFQHNELEDHGTSTLIQGVDRAITFAQEKRSKTCTISTSELKKKLDAATGISRNSFLLPTKCAPVEKDKKWYIPGEPWLRMVKSMDFNAKLVAGVPFKTKDVPYYIDDSFPAGKVFDRINTTMRLMAEDFKAKSCINIFQVDKSYKGKRLLVTQSWGPKCRAIQGAVVQVGRSCEGLVFHELGHGLGLSEMSLGTSDAPYAAYTAEPKGGTLYYSGKNPILNWVPDPRLTKNLKGQMPHYDLEKVNRIYDCGKNHDKPGRQGWSAWSYWTACDLQCKRFRSRFCTNPVTKDNKKPCGDGPSKQFETCASCNIKQAGGYAAWTNWKTCSLPCGGGVQYKHRYCWRPLPAANGTDCDKTDAIRRRDFDYTMWVRIQVKKQSCNTEACKLIGGALKYQHLGCYKDSGSSRRLPRLVGSRRGSTDYSKPETLAAAVKWCAQAALSNDWTYFAVQHRGECWSGKDQDTKDFAKFGKSTACKGGVGGGYANDVYRLIRSSQNGNWSSWSAWSTCENNVRTRSRSCSNPPPSLGGATCPGNDMEKTSCKLKTTITSAPLEALGTHKKVIPVGERKRIYVWRQKVVNSQPIQGPTDNILIYKAMGCFKDSRNRRLPKYLGPKSVDLTNPDGIKALIKWCVIKAYSKGWTVVGLQDSDECWSGPDHATKNYDSFGRKDNCVDGVGRGWSNYVYKLVKPQGDVSKLSLEYIGHNQNTKTIDATLYVWTPTTNRFVLPIETNDKTIIQSMGCFKDSGSKRTLPKLWGNGGWDLTDPDQVKKAIKRCALKAYAQKYNVFGLQYKGRECWSGPDDATKNYDRLGEAENCEKGVGGGYANNVYKFVHPKGTAGWTTWNNWTKCQFTGICGHSSMPSYTERTRTCHCINFNNCAQACAGNFIETKVCAATKTSTACPGYRYRGCWAADGVLKGEHIIPLLEQDKDVKHLLDYSPRDLTVKDEKSGKDINVSVVRADAVLKCATAARMKGFKAFALEPRGLCVSGPNIMDTFALYGDSYDKSKCPAGIGNTISNKITVAVYEFL